MKFLLVCLLFTVIAIQLLSTAAEKPRKLKKYRSRHRTTTETADTKYDTFEDKAEEGDVITMLEEDEIVEKKLSGEDSEDSSVDVKENEVMLHDACYKKHCGAGRVCNVTENGEAVCVCISNCPQEIDPRRKVCSNHNETWSSDCQIYQMRCWCDLELDGCKGEEFKHVHIDYYGECREMPECTSEEMSDFPRRMRDWLFNIMRDLADRKELSPHYFKMEREAETNMTKRWINAAVWKWCDLDGHPQDRSVSRHELFPIRAPLMSLEHCIAPFFQSCDSDDNHHITLREWGKCLQLDEDELEEKCDEIRDY